jgi:hypothetical protein
MSKLKNVQFFYAFHIAALLKRARITITLATAITIVCRRAGDSSK